MRVQGSIGVMPLECINPYKNKWRVRWDIKPNTGVDEQGVTNTGTNYEEAEFLYKPTIVDIKRIVTSWYNEQIDNNIRNGFVYNDIPVWLSTENQFNYKAAYDLAVQTNGASLPTIFKFGTEDEPIYNEFTTVETLGDFYTKALTYVNSTLISGWDIKDNIDWSVYNDQPINNE